MTTTPKGEQPQTLEQFLAELAGDIEADLIGHFNQCEELKPETWEERIAQLRDLAEKVTGAVIIKPDVQKHPQGFMTGKTHYVARIGATGNQYGNTPEEAVANLQAIIDGGVQ